MSKNEKLIARLLNNPKDFTWEELTKVMTTYGYAERNKGKTGGSRRKYVDSKKNTIILHKPHPGNIIKKYALDQVIDHLKEKGYIKDE